MSEQSQKNGLPKHLDAYLFRVPTILKELLFDPSGEGMDLGASIGSVRIDNEELLLEIKGNKKSKKKESEPIH